jgi:hypothetical protein
VLSAAVVPRNPGQPGNENKEDHHGDTDPDHDALADGAIVLVGFLGIADRLGHRHGGLLLYGILDYALGEKAVQIAVLMAVGESSAKNYTVYIPGVYRSMEDLPWNTVV